MHKNVEVKAPPRLSPLSDLSKSETLTHATDLFHA